MTSRPEELERRVQRVRIGTAVAAILSGAGLICGLVTRVEPIIFCFGWAFLFCLVVVSGLIVEQVAATWRASARFQVSLRTFLVATSLLGVFFASLQFSGTPIPCLAVVLMVMWFCFALEQRTLKPSDRPDESSDHP